MWPPRNKVAKLTHFGRRTGKAYEVSVWWVEIEGAVWIGSLDDRRSWVRNVRAAGCAEIDCGQGKQKVYCEWVPAREALQRFRAAIRCKHPLMGRILPLLFERQSCAFRTRPASDDN